MNEAELSKKMQELENKGGKDEQSREENLTNDSNYKPPNEFKIALAAMCAEEDYKILEDQFFSGN